MREETFLLLGGAGLVGVQVARRVITDLAPSRVVVASLEEGGARRAVADLRSIFPNDPTDIVAEWGDVFLREEYCRRRRLDLLDDPEAREGIFADLLGPIDEAYERCSLTRLILRHRPDVIVDTINAATAISYQDVYTASILAKRSIDELLSGNDPDADIRTRTKHDVEALILSQAVPQLIRHVLFLDRAMREVGTRLYLKVGTTGTGGMGLNIPYTHSEDRPSAKLMSKTSVAFAHTGLLFLLARTAGAPIVKEIKPAALVGYAAVEHRAIVERGEPVHLYASQLFPLEGRLSLRLPAARFDRLSPLQLPVVDTGENGVFTKGEFEAITSIGQMEFVTPEEVAFICVQEIIGGNTGRDIVDAVDASLVGPSFRAGVLRADALDALERLEISTGTHSVALGQLGPPELSKLLWEAELLRLAFGSLPKVLASTASEISMTISGLLDARPDLRDTITSLGLPILSADGSTLQRGPFLRIPEVAGDRDVPVGEQDVDRWAQKGWIDLRPANSIVWQRRFAAMREARGVEALRGSASIIQEAYALDEIAIGSVAAWVLANEHAGYRVK